MIVIIDHGSGNLRSIQWAFQRAGEKTVIAADPENLAQATRIILPGVGSFGAAMEALRQQKLLDVLRQKVEVEHTPILGICLGFQMLFEGSDEGVGEGLGWLPGRARKFPAGELKVPQLGWNEIKPAAELPISAELRGGSTFYFAHSFYVQCEEPLCIAGTTSYGIEYTSIIQKENIFGAQFHPEKSHMNGLRFLQRFLELTAHA